MPEAGAGRSDVSGLREGGRVSRYVTDNGGGIVWASDESELSCEEKLALAERRIVRLERMVDEAWVSLPLYTMDTVKKEAS